MSMPKRQFEILTNVDSKKGYNGRRKEEEKKRQQKFVKKGGKI